MPNSTPIKLNNYCMIISGDMYSGLPQKEQASQPEFMPGFARPRSAILMWPSIPRRMFSGFMSRQITFWAWRQDRPRKIYIMQNLAIYQLNRRYFLIRPKSSPPAQYSSTKTIYFSAQNAYLSSIINGCLASSMISLSFMTIFFFLFLTTISFSMSFMAQNWLSCLDLQRKTLEKPPDPICFISQKSCMEIWWGEVDGRVVGSGDGIRRGGSGLR